MSQVKIVVIPAPPSDHSSRRSSVNEANSDSESSSDSKAPMLKAIGRQPHYRDLNVVISIQLIRKRSASSNS